MNVEVKVEGKDLVIRIPMNAQPEVSTSGKSLVVASTHGNLVTAAQVNGKPLTLGLNAYIKR